MKPKSLLRELNSLLDESKLIIDTDKMPFDFELIRRGAQQAIGKDFGTMVVTPRFGKVGSKIGVSLSIKFSGLGKVAPEEFASLVGEVLTDQLGREGKVKTSSSAVEWIFTIA